jgi:hypothetical protein
MGRGPHGQLKRPELTYLSPVAYAHNNRRVTMGGIVYIVGAVVIVLFILGFFGLR